MCLYLARRSSNILGTFTRFGLRPTGYHPSYQTVQKLGRNDIEFFGNVTLPLATSEEEEKAG